MGVTIPAMLPLKFMAPPSTPALSRPPRIDGTLHIRPIQRRKNSTDASSATALTGSGIARTASSGAMTRTPAPPSSERSTLLLPMPRERR